MDQDERLMQKVIRLAQKGSGRVSPNPLVGALITRRGVIVGAGYHRKAGTPHAEVNAILQAGEKAKGGILYLNLEPCCHTEKRTPPCTEAIMKSGIKKVVVGMRDPNPKVNGKGIAILRRHGILVREGVSNEKARILNEFFTRFITTRLPFVSLKIAATLDGKIATSTGRSRWITGEKARVFVHHLRNQYDAVLVGSGTVLADNPELTTRLASGYGRNPVRILVDENLSVPPDYRVYKKEAGDRVIVATTRQAAASKKKALEQEGVQVVEIKEKEGWVDLPSLIRTLGEMEVTSVLIEGGSRINASSLREGLVDKIYYLMAPKLMGGEDALSAIGGSSPESLSFLPELKKTRIRKLGEDFLIEGYLHLILQNEKSSPG